MAVFTNNLSAAAKPADVRVSLASGNMSMRNEFQRWLTDGKNNTSDEVSVIVSEVCRAYMKIQENRQ